MRARTVGWPRDRVALRVRCVRCITQWRRRLQLVLTLRAAALLCAVCRCAVSDRTHPLSTMSSPQTRRFFVGGNWKCVSRHSRPVDCSQSHRIPTEREIIPFAPADRACCCVVSCLLVQNGTKASISALVSGLNKAEVPTNVDVIVAPTFLHIDLVQRTLTNKSIEVSAQNCVQFKAGAYTGELSPDLIKDAGIPYVILGHSERRALFHTDDETVGKQVAAALAQGLKVIACVGETLQEREANQTMKVIERQLKAIAANVNDWARVVVAYEPVWAIGTGKVGLQANSTRQARTRALVAVAHMCSPFSLCSCLSRPPAPLRRRRCTVSCVSCSTRTSPALAPPRVSSTEAA